MSYRSDLYACSCRVNSEEPTVVLATVPTRYNSSTLWLEPEQNRCNRLYYKTSRTVATGPVFPPKTRNFIITTLAKVKYLSCDRIVT